MTKKEILKKYKEYILSNHLKIESIKDKIIKEAKFEIFKESDEDFFLECLYLAENVFFKIPNGKYYNLFSNPSFISNFYLNISLPDNKSVKEYGLTKEEFWQEFNEAKKLFYITGMIGEEKKRNAKAFSGLVEKIHRYWTEKDLVYEKYEKKTNSEDLIQKTQLKLVCLYGEYLRKEGLKKQIIADFMSQMKIYDLFFSVRDYFKENFGFRSTNLIDDSNFFKIKNPSQISGIIKDFFVGFGSMDKKPDEIIYFIKKEISARIGSGVLSVTDALSEIKEIEENIKKTGIPLSLKESYSKPEEYLGDVTIPFFEEVFKIDRIKNIEEILAEYIVKEEKEVLFNALVEVFPFAFLKKKEKVFPEESLSKTVMKIISQNKEKVLDSFFFNNLKYIYPEILRNKESNYLYGVLKKVFTKNTIEIESFSESLRKSDSVKILTLNLLIPFLREEMYNSDKAFKNLLIVLKSYFENVSPDESVFLFYEHKGSFNDELVNGNRIFYLSDVLCECRRKTVFQYMNKQREDFFTMLKKIFNKKHAEKELSIDAIFKNVLQTDVLLNFNFYHLKNKTYPVFALSDLNFIIDSYSMGTDSFVHLKVTTKDIYDSNMVLLKKLHAELESFIENKHTQRKIFASFFKPLIKMIAKEKINVKELKKNIAKFVSEPGIVYDEKPFAGIINKEPENSFIVNNQEKQMRKEFEKLTPGELFYFNIVFGREIADFIKNLKNPSVKEISRK